MPTTTDRKQHLKVSSTQLEMDTRSSLGSNPLAEDLNGKMQEAESQIQQLQQQQEELERQQEEMREINECKEEFLHGQVEMNERLTSAVTAMEREIFAARQEIDELEQARICFVDHLEKINGLNPDGWNNESLRQDLNRAISVLDLAEDEYEQAVAHFSGGRSASVFGAAPAKAKRVAASTAEPNEFFAMLKNGLAFNLPMLVLGALALMIWLSK